MLVALSFASTHSNPAGLDVEHVHGGFAAIEAIQLFHPSLHAAMNLVLQHVPFEA